MLHECLMCRKIAYCDVRLIRKHLENNHDMCVSTYFERFPQANPQAKRQSTEVLQAVEETNFLGGNLSSSHGHNLAGQSSTTAATGAGNAELKKNEEVTPSVTSNSGTVAGVITTEASNLCR